MTKAPEIIRRKAHKVLIGGIPMGGDAPIMVQSMTNTDTSDAQSTAQQVFELAEAGSEIVRITVDTDKSAAQVGTIRKLLDDMGCDVPLVGDFHYNGHTLLTDYPECAKALAKYRINPGNVGFGKKKDAQFQTMVEIAIKYNKPVRIGVNWGSLDQALLTHMMDENSKLDNPKEVDEVSREAIITSAINSAKQAEEIGLPADKIVISCKVSRVQNLVAIYRELAKRCDYALHLGLTEAGMGDKGIVSSAAALSVLMQEGIGDTIRVSLTPEPGGNRAREVIVAQEILQSMGFRSFSPQVTACPGCGRTTSEFFQVLAQSTEEFLRKQMPVWGKEYEGVAAMEVAVMGCIVNGPGESKHANIGISLPGTGESPAAPIFIDGQKVQTLRGDNIASEFQDIISDYVKDTYNKIDNKEAA